MTSACANSKMLTEVKTSLRHLDAHFRASQVNNHLRLGYDLPRLGFKAADTWFLLGAHKIFDSYCKMSKLRVTKKQHWEILKTFVYALFNETIEAKAIEQLIRSKCKDS